MGDNWGILKTIGDALDSRDIRFKLVESRDYISVLVKNKRGDNLLALYSVNQISLENIISHAEGGVS